MNIDKYIENMQYSDNGHCYKNEQAFKKKRGICYVSESQMTELELLQENYMDRSDRRLVRESLAETYYTIMESAEQNWENLSEEQQENFGSLENFAEYAFQQCDWQNIETEMFEITNYN